MFGELPKLFDRNFAVGYLLPAAWFVIAMVAIKDAFGLFPGKYPFVFGNLPDLAFNFTIIGFSSLFIGIVLTIINYEIYRFLEGYGKYNPLGLWSPIEKWRYGKLQRNLNENKQTRDWYKERGEAIPETFEAERMELLLFEKNRFPQEQYLLPTAFGNIIRAFEIYPRVLYGIDAIPGWDRLQAVIPKDYSNLINDAKAQTDFWMNTWLLSSLAVIGYLALAIYYWESRYLWLPALFIAVAIIASRRAKQAAVGWGSLIKASFDLYLPDLRAKLALPVPKSIDEEREMWTKFSTAILYRHQKSVVSRDAAQLASAGSQKKALPNAEESAKADE